MTTPLPVSRRIVFRDQAYLAIKMGLVPGMSLVEKFGKNTSLDDADGFRAIWDGGSAAYTGQAPTASDGEAVEVLSSSANDSGTLISSGTATSGSATTLVDTAATFSSDGVAVGDIVINDSQDDHFIVTAVTSETTLTGIRWKFKTTLAVGDSYRVAQPNSTGAAVVRLNMLQDSVGADGAEYIILNGTTPVDTVGTDYVRCFRGRVVCGDLVSGVAATNIGTITARQTTTVANIFFVIIAAWGSTEVAAYRVPAGKTGYILSWSGGLIGVGSMNVECRLRLRPVGEPWQVADDLTLRGGGSSNVEHHFAGGLSVDPFTDIVIEADTNTDSTSLRGGVCLVLVDD